MTSASRPDDIEVARAFTREVKARVNDYFERNRISRHANAAMVAKTLVLLSIYFGAYALIISGQVPLAGMWLLCLVAGVAMAGIGFAVTHDALHGAYSANPRINHLVGCLFETLGANGYMWKVTHNGIHHTYTNIQGYDEDLEVSPLIRLSPHTPHRPVHRFQHLFAFAAYSLATVFWVFAKDFKYFLQKDLGPHRNKRHPIREWVMLIAGKLFYYTMAIAVPLLLLDLTWWQFVIGFLTVHLTAGLILGVIFQLAHVVEPTEHLADQHAGMLKGTWMLHQMRTTNNFARNNRLLSWYVGGLNFQIEHHLFPRICHVHYRQLSPIVEEVAARHGVPYNSSATLCEAIGSHYRMLKTLGQPDGVPTLAHATSS